MIHINLLPTREVEEASSRRKEVAIAGGILILALTAVSAIHLFQLQNLRLAQAKVDGLESQITQIRKQNKELNELIKKKDLLENKLKAVKSLTSPQRRSVSVRILDDLSLSTPELLWITDFTGINGVAKIQGESVDNQTVATFAHNLVNSLSFQNVEIRETVHEVQNSNSRRRGRERRKGENEPTVQIKRFLIEATIPTYGQQPKNDATETGKKRRS